MFEIIKKWKTAGGQCPPRASMTDIGFSWFGGFIAIGLAAYLAEISHSPLVLGSFGASCVLLFGFPDSPFSQPRNVIGGHFLASLVGLLLLSFAGAHWWSMAIAAASGIAIMQLTRTVHPPAGSNPVIVMLAGSQWQFLITPTLVGAVLLVLVALFFNNIRKDRTYPKYWY